jgi:hypothetical protein
MIDVITLDREAAAAAAGQTRDFFSSSETL